MGRSSLLLILFMLLIGGMSGSFLLPSTLLAQAPSTLDIPTPASVIGHEVGADTKLARWETIVSYFRRLGAASNRVNVRDLEPSTEGAPYLLLEISSEETMADLPRYRKIQSKLADPRLIEGAEDRARILKEAKTTIIVTCGLHSSECAGSQMAMELAYDLATGEDERTKEILEKCIILLVPSANPDGNNKIVDWYNKYIGTPFEGGRMPWLYQKYAGHDNNRDWFMLNLKETRILTDVMYHEWYPTISYDVHQMGNRGPRFFVPPFFDPVNPNVDPLIHQSLLLIGGHMATELQENGKKGVVYKAIYDNWWQGGNRTTPYRHNVVGILTEAASAKMASPVFQTMRDLRGGSRGFPNHDPAVNFPEPWTGGWWRLRDVVDYELLSCRALFTLGARYRDRFVQNHLTLSDKALRLGREEPPFAWLVPPDQRDPGSAEKMIRILQMGGIEAQMAVEAFTADGREYPRGTCVFLAEQPYRPHLKDMMERQEYPDRRQYANGPAEAPYDSAGWTLPLQMGVRTVEVGSAFDKSNLRPIDIFVAQQQVPAADVGVSGFITKRRGNQDYAVLNALLMEGHRVSVLSATWKGYPVGSAVVSRGKKGEPLVPRMRELTTLHRGARFDSLSSIPEEQILDDMGAPRTALYQPWTSSMDEGWTRLVLEEFDFPYETVHNAEIRAGSLRDRFDCIIIPDLSLSSLLNGASDKTMPSPYHGGIGEDGALVLERFVRDGGTLVLMDSATALATDLLRMPVRNRLQGLGQDEFFCPGSLLRLRVDQRHPLGFGFDEEVAAYFNRSQAFEVGKNALLPSKDEKKEGKTRALTEEEIEKKAGSQPVGVAASYADNIVLQSGWILGPDHVRNRAAICEVSFGSGRVVLLGLRVQHRGQPHGTFKFLFNAIYRSTLGDG